MNILDCKVGTRVVMPSGLVATVTGPGEDGGFVLCEYEDGAPSWQPPGKDGHAPRSKTARTADMRPELLVRIAR